MNKKDNIEKTLKDNEIAFEIISTNRYGIDDITYKKILATRNGAFFLSIIIPLIFASISILLLESVIGYSIIFLMFIIIAYLILFQKKIYLYSKYTLLMRYIVLLFFCISIFLCSISFLPLIVSGTFLGVIIVFIIAAIIGESILGYKYYSSVWNKSKKYNETKILDLENSIFDYYQDFKIDESKLNNKKRKISQDTIYNFIIPASTSMAVLLSFILGKLSHLIADFDLRYLIFPILGVFVGMGFMKLSMVVFHNFIKIIHYEKQIGKPIKNGLIIKNK